MLGFVSQVRDPATRRSTLRSQLSLCGIRLGLSVLVLPGYGTAEIEVRSVAQRVRTSWS